VDRRAFIAVIGGGLLAAPLVAEGQQPGKVYRIGMLETRATVLNAANIDAFRQGLRELGYKEGRNLEIVYRSSDGRDQRFPGLASELVRLQVDLILTRGTPAALAAKSVTRTIPVVMAASGDNRAVIRVLKKYGAFEDVPDKSYQPRLLVRRPRGHQARRSARRSGDRSD